LSADFKLQLLSELGGGISRSNCKGKKNTRGWLDKISSKHFWIFGTEIWAMTWTASQVIMPESGEVAELIFTEISNGCGEELLVRVDGKEGGVSVH